MKVVRILPDRLIVEQGGRLGTIELFHKRPAKDRAYGKAGRRIFPLKSSAAGRVTHVRLRKKEVQNALKDMATFLRQVRIVPYLKKGSAKGFKLLEIVPGSIVARVGLKNGDIIESVNGKPIQTPQDAFQLFTALQEGKGISLVYKRNYRKMTVVIDLK
jgi:type II secretion system protein C